VRLRSLELTDSFHVAEDLLTTFTTFILATVVSAMPESVSKRPLVDDRIQLIFQEGYKLESNHFTPLWDRVGAWAPRRLSLDPWEENVCRKWTTETRLTKS
jgi:hypothetical protein